MEQAPAAATIIVQLFEGLSGNDIDGVIQEVEKVFPERGEAIHRLVVSYSWQLLATYKVISYTDCIGIMLVNV